LINSFKDTDLRWYGRRTGKPLRKARKKLHEELLPIIQIDPELRNIPTDLKTLFPNPVREVWLEIGFGGGEHLAEQAEKNPDVGIIGCEPFVNGVASLMKHLDGNGVTNVRVYDDDVRHLLKLMAPESLERIFILFPDPWPKSRHHRRRIVKDETILQFAYLLKNGGELRFSSDHQGYVSWALRHLLQNNDISWIARRPSDWRIPPLDWVVTRYEQKAKAKGDPPTYLRFERKRRIE
jgi:tRNA (guanine-N7-)-methyltransferase